MFTSTVWTDDSKLLQELNLTARHPRRAPIMLYISFNSQPYGDAEFVSLASTNAPDVSHYSTHTINRPFSTWISNFLTLSLALSETAIKSVVAVSSLWMLFHLPTCLVILFSPVVICINYDCRLPFFSGPSPKMKPISTCRSSATDIPEIARNQILPGHSWQSYPFLYCFDKNDGLNKMLLVVSCRI